MALRKIKAFESDFDIEVSKAECNEDSQLIRIVVRDSGGIILDKTVQEGTTVSCRLQNRSMEIK